MKKLLRSPVPRAQSLLSQQNRYTQPAASGQSLSRDIKAKWLQTLPGHSPALPGMSS